MDSSTIFRIHIPDGYSFRNAMGIAKTETERTTMILCRNIIEFNVHNVNTKKAYHNIVLKGNELVEYKLDSKDKSGKQLDYYYCTFEVGVMFNATRGTGKKDGLLLQLDEGKNSIIVRRLKSGEEQGQVSFAVVSLLREIPPTRATEPGTYQELPNIKILTKSFSELCNKVAGNQCKELNFMEYLGGVLLVGIKTDNSWGTCDKFGEVPLSAFSMNASSAIESKKSKTEDESNNSHVKSVRVPISTIKALSKINNIAPQNSVLKIYFSKTDQIVKLNCQVSSYGEYSCYLFNERRIKIEK